MCEAGRVGACCCEGGAEVWERRPDRHQEGRSEYAVIIRAFVSG